MNPAIWPDRAAGVIYREALPVALATLRTINMRGAYVKGALDFVHGCPIDLELRLPHRRGGRIEFTDRDHTRAALEGLLRTGQH